MVTGADLLVPAQHAPLGRWHSRDSGTALAATATVALLVAVVLGLAGASVLDQVHVAQGSVCASDNAACALSQRLVRAAFQAFGVKALFVAAVLGLYAGSLGVSAVAPRVRRWYLGGVPWPVHWGWTVTAMAWICYAALFSLQGETDQAHEPLRLVGPALLASACFIHGIGVGVTWQHDATGARRLAWPLAGGFVALAVVELATSGATGKYIAAVHDAFASTDVRELLERIGLGTEYWLYSLSDSSGPLGAFLDQTPWLVLGYVYVLTATTRQHVPAFFRNCPSYGPLTVRAGRWAWDRRDWLYAWLPAAVAFSLYLVALATAAATGELSAAAPGPRSESARAAARCLVLAPVYLVLLVPALGYAAALAAESGTAAEVAAVASVPKERRERLDQASPSLWLLYCVGGLMAGNAYLWTAALGWPPAARLTALIASWPRTAPAAQVWAFGLVVAVVVVVHYYLLVERPFSAGQRRWKSASLSRTGQTLSRAEWALREQLAAARASGIPIDLIQPSDPPGAPPGAVGSSAARRRALTMLVASYAGYQLAQEQDRRARAIPVHSVKSTGDLLGKLAKAALTGVGQAVIFGKPAAAGAQDAGQSAFKDVLDWVIKRVVGGG